MTSEPQTDYQAVIEKLQSDIDGLKTQLFYLINIKTEFTHNELEVTRLELQQTKAQLNEVLTEQFVGAVSAFAMFEPPSGWLECNGQAVNRIESIRLFNKIGTMFGAGDKETTFNLPDLKGVFVRGWERFAGGHDSGRAFGTYPDDQMQSHKHEGEGHSHVIQSTKSYELHQLQRASFLAQGNSFIETRKSVLSVPISSEMETAVRHGNETRPKNVALLFCIKY